MSAQQVKGEEHHCSLLCHPSPEAPSVQGAEEERLVGLLLQIQTNFQQERAWRFVLPQLPLSLSVLCPWSRAMTAASLGTLLPVLRAAEDI